MSPLLLSATPSSNDFCRAAALADASGDGPALPTRIMTSGFSPTETRVPTVPASPSFSAVML